MNTELKTINIEIAVARNADFKNQYRFEFWAANDYSRKEIFGFIIESRNEWEAGVGDSEDDSNFLIYSPEHYNLALKDIEEGMLNRTLRNVFYRNAAKELFRFLSLAFEKYNMDFLDYQLVFSFKKSCCENPESFYNGLSIDLLFKALRKLFIEVMELEKKFSSVGDEMAGCFFSLARYRHKSKTEFIFDQATYRYVADTNCIIARKAPGHANINSEAY